MTGDVVAQLPELRILLPRKLPTKTTSHIQLQISQRNA
ncbi:hypothetical protein GAGA_0870 [Paraglaciecola agarilytica NO2]|uniref:Uncharacterized protein n=1 Tax=Paraglaciecola agarilytica NO2 TaxID=1125747 RepID=A0ABQ0I367_9ALTE|nr:hypothetical protein GAGA_0870 [Paraglaciecola agarilytica NO2]